MELYDGLSDSFSAAGIDLAGWCGGLCHGRLPNGLIPAHFFEGFRRKSANRQQIIHALERAVRLQHLQDRDKWFARSSARAQRVIEFGLAEEGRLLLNLRAIADDDDLHVGRV